MISVSRGPPLTGVENAVQFFHSTTAHPDVSTLAWLVDPPGTRVLGTCTLKRQGLLGNW